MKQPRVIATVEARMGSSRLPGKSMKLILGKPVLELLLERLRRSQTIHDIVVATTTQPEDVLDRVARAADWAAADVIAEITGDCPLTCPEVVDEAVRRFLKGDIDYLSNLLVQTYPQAVDFRVFRAKDLKEINETLAGEDASLREHVYLYFEEHAEKYRVHVMKAPPEYHRPEWRLDLDFPEDLVLLTKIFGALYPQNPAFTLKDLIA